MSTFKMLSWAAVIVWMAFIFLLSHQPAEESRELSRGMTEVIVEKIEKIAPQKKFEFHKLHYLIRKNAHFFAYLVLGILVLNAVRRSGDKEIQSLGIALIVCVFYALSDEIHQLFVPGRSGEWRDVMIDTAGALFGMGLYLIASGLSKRMFSMGRKTL